MLSATICWTRKNGKEIKKNPEAYVTARLTQLNQVYMEYYQTRFRPTYAAICEGPEAVAQMEQTFHSPRNPDCSYCSHYQGDAGHHHLYRR